MENHKTMQKGFTKWRYEKSQDHKQDMGCINVNGTDCCFRCRAKQNQNFAKMMKTYLRGNSMLAKIA